MVRSIEVDADGGHALDGSLMSVTINPTSMTGRGSAGEHEKEQEEQNHAPREDTEPEGGDRAAPHPPKPLHKVSRELTDDDLAARGVQKMLVGNVDRLEREVEFLTASETGFVTPRGRERFFRNASRSPPRRRWFWEGY